MVGTWKRWVGLPRVAGAALLILGSTHAIGDGTAELDSTPRQAVGPITEAPAPDGSAPPEAYVGELPVSIANQVTVGLNVELSRLGNSAGESTFIPPDTMGAVGPSHVVEMINGNFEIFNKATGASISTRTLNAFWTNVVGLTIPAGAGTFDPRIVFDPVSERWFALSIDGSDRNGDGVNETVNDVFVARSDTSDPTGDWDGFTFVADTTGGGEFHDYPTLAVDADGLYLCTQDFGFGGGTNESCYSIPKADLLAATPTAANLTRFEATPAGLPTVTGSIQPALDFGLSDGRAALLGSTGSALTRTDVFGAAGPGATLGTPVAITGDPGHAAPPAARQPNDTDTTDTETIENVAPRFVGNVVEVGDSLWAVHAVAGSGSNSALRWYEIDETTNTVLQTGLVDDPNRDFHEPSIAVNPRGDVVIGYTCSGPTLAASVCVSVGQTSAGITTFEPPAILVTGGGVYHRDFRNPTTGAPSRNRWGDYSATVVDPVDPCTFWTFQEYVAVGATGDVGPSPDAEGGTWGTRVTQLTFDACVAEVGAQADVKVFKECKPDQPLGAGQTGTCTILVTNLGPDPALAVSAVDTHVSNGTFTIGTVTTSRGSCTTTANPQIRNGVVTCDLGTLLTDESVTITVPVSATEPQDVNDDVRVSSSTPDPNLANNQAADGLGIVAVADLALTKVAAPSPVVAGTQLTYSLSVTNAGPSAAKNVVVEDVLPTGVTIASVSSPDGTCNAGVPGDAALPTRCTVDTIDPGGSAAMQIVVNVLPDTRGTLGNNARTSSDAFDPDNSNDLATVATQVTAQADLQVTKTDVPDPVVAGADLTYDVTITNAGPSTATEVQLADTLPAGVTFKSATVSNGTGTCSLLAPVVSCDLNDLAPGAFVRVVVVVTVASSVPDGTVLVNSATAASATPDPNAANDVAQAPTTVIARADLALVKDGQPDVSNPAKRFRYTLTATNKGLSDALNVQLVDELPLDPKKIVFLYDTGAGACSYSLATHDVTCSLGTVRAGETRSIDIVIDVKGTTGIIVNLAHVTSTTVDPVLADNDARKDLRVKGGPGK